MTGSQARIGVAISGGGFRATAFGLGCLRALQDTGLLASISVISGISGGSLLAPLYAYGPADFSEFDAITVDLLDRGLQGALIRRALKPGMAGRNLVAATDLRTSNAVRFGSLRSSCSAYGTITEPVTVADAVAASAAFPLLLPAIERAYNFTRPGTQEPSQQIVLLSDGGIYD